jgi:hypothetical protein
LDSNYERGCQNRQIGASGKNDRPFSGMHAAADAEMAAVEPEE